MMERIKLLFNELRHDPDALFELRQLLFGIIIVAGVVFAFYTMYVQSKEKDQVKLLAQEKQLKVSLGNGEIESLTAMQLDKAKEDVTILQEKIDLLTFKEQMFREEYKSGDDEEAFANVIFTLLPRSPVDIENEFAQMNVLEKRSLEYYSIFPVNIQGDSGYSQLLSYLQYIENRPEVGMIDSLKLEELEGTSFGQEVQLHFNLVLGRIKLK